MLMGVPIRGFAAAKSRLGDALAPERRQALMQAVASRTIAAGRAVGWEAAIVTGAADVADWCHQAGIAVIADAGDGLDHAAHRVVALAGDRPWAVVHGDLPLITAGDLDLVSGHLANGRTVLAPSRDGGTNLVAGRGDFAFRYGPGSFTRHLATAAHRFPQVLVTAGLAVEIDTPEDLVVVAAAGDGAWIGEFLS